jgi:hypothetical protein
MEKASHTNIKHTVQKRLQTDTSWASTRDRPDKNAGLFTSVITLMQTTVDDDDDDDGGIYTAKFC